MRIELRLAVHRVHDLNQHADCRPMSEPASILSQLMTVIEDRRREMPEKSYTTRLFQGGVARIGEKITEEAAEVVEAISRRKETGAGILAALRTRGLGFLRLHKTNAWAPHPVMGALYGDLIFHLGAGSRAPRFKTDKKQYGIGDEPVADRLRTRINGTIQRFLLNEQCVRQGKPMVDCAMYELTGQVTTILPGRTACLACRVPEPPATWRRQFPVIGAVSGAVGCLGAMEAIKLITGLGEPLADRLLTFDLRDVRFRTLTTARRADCPVCGNK